MSMSAKSEIPWYPQVSLISHSTAPLASRISNPPQESHVPSSLQPKALRELSLEAQEAYIIEDLLMVLMGSEGRYTQSSKAFDTTSKKDRLAGSAFVILPGLDRSLRYLTIDILKLATYCGALEAFIDVQGQAEFGVVNHALDAAIRKLLFDYLSLIVQLETQFLTSPTFTLHVLNLHTLPARALMSQVFSVAQALTALPLDDDNDAELDFENILEAIQDGDMVIGSNTRMCKGGKVLDLITRRLESLSGDPATRAALTSLLRDSSCPYMRILNEWLHHRSINDPYAEFLVKEQKSIKSERLYEDYTDDYWERRHTLRSEVPPQLETVKDKVLLAGKYLNVVRECGEVNISKAITNVPITFEDPLFFDNINNAYAYANKALLNLLLTTYDLPARLYAIKRYFFLSGSDYISHFLELALHELRKQMGKVNIGKLQAVLDLVLPAQDLFRDNVKVELNSVSLIDGLTRVINISGIEDRKAPVNPLDPPIEGEKGPLGITSFQLDCAVSFPASLAISRKTVWRYQALFRHLVSLKFLEQQLPSNWQTLNKSPSWAHKSSNKEVEFCKRRAFALRARMLAYIQQLLYFCTSEVIEPNWQGFIEKLQEGSNPYVNTVDDLMQNHVDFLDTCLKECMLTNARLLSLSRELESNDPNLIGNSKPSSMQDQQWLHFQNNKKQASTISANVGVTTPPLEKMVTNLKKFEINFGGNMHKLLDELNHSAATETVVLLGLCARLSNIHQDSEFGGSRSKTDDGMDI